MLVSFTASYSVDTGGQICHRWLWWKAVRSSVMLRAVLNLFPDAGYVRLSTYHMKVKPSTGDMSYRFWI